MNEPDRPASSLSRELFALAAAERAVDELIVKLTGRAARRPAGRLRE